MAVWIVRAGMMGENENFALRNGMYSVGPSVNQSVVDFSDREAWRNTIPVKRSFADEIWRFARNVEKGDKLVLVRRQTKSVAIGKVVGDYVYCYVERPDESLAPLPHTREVEWLIKSVPLESFDEDLQKSFKSSQGNVVRIRKPNSEGRIERAIATVFNVKA